MHNGICWYRPPETDRSHILCKMPGSHQIKMREGQSVCVIREGHWLILSNWKGKGKRKGQEEKLIHYRGNRKIHEKKKLQKEKKKIRPQLVRKLRSQLGEWDDSSVYTHTHTVSDYPDTLTTYYSSQHIEEFSAGIHIWLRYAASFSVWLFIVTLMHYYSSNVKQCKSWTESAIERPNKNTTTTTTKFQIQFQIKQENLHQNPTDMCKAGHK